MTIEDAELVELLHDLDGDPPEPSTVELDRAVRDGRRRVRRRAVVTGAAAVVTVLATVTATSILAGSGHRQRPAEDGTVAASPSDPAAAVDVGPPVPGDCTAQVLPAPPGYTGIVVMGMDPTGRYLVGRGFSPDRRYHALLWTDGQLSTLDPNGTLAEVGGIAVNSAGVVAWSSSEQVRDGYVRTSWRYTGGQSVKLNVPPDFVVSAVTGAGDVLAVSAQFATSGHWLNLLAAGGALAVHEVSATQPVHLRKVDLDGAVVANEDPTAPRPDDSAALAMAWTPDGSAHPLTAPNGYAPDTVANDVSGDWVVGNTRTFTGKDPAEARRQQATEKSAAIRWNLRTTQRRAFPDLSTAQGVNRYGWFTGADTASRPVAVFGDQVRVLPLPAHAEAGAGTFGTAISDDGRIIAGQANLPKTVAAVRWSCG